MTEISRPQHERRARPRLTPAELLTLALRAATEAGVVAGLAYWGFTLDGSTVLRVAAGVGAPALGFGFWGAVDFRDAGRLAEPLRLVQELALSGLAAGALVAAGRSALGIGLALLSAVYHALVYLLGGRLLDAGPQPTAGAEPAPRREGR